MDQPTDAQSVSEERRRRKLAYNREYYRRNRDRIREECREENLSPEQIQAKRDHSREYNRRRRAADPEFRARCNAAAKRHRERHRERLAAERRERERIKMQDPAYRERQNAKAKRKRERVKSDPARLAARQLRDREYLRKRRADPAFREKTNREQRERQRGRYATDPEYRRSVILRVCARKPWDATVTVESVGAMLESQGGRCAACRCDIREGYHLDHIYPLAKGGESTLTNLQLLCGPCNMAKRDRTAFFPAGQEQGLLAL